MRDAQQAGDIGVAARLRKQAAGLHEGVGVDEDDSDIGCRRSGGHVARVLLVAGGVRDEELALAGGEVTVGYVNGDALLALGLQAVGEQAEVHGLAAAVDAAGAYAGELVLVDALGVMQQAADERALAVVDGAGGGEAQHLLIEMGVEEGAEGGLARGIGSEAGGAHQK